MDNKEKWKIIKGYDSRYKISNRGSVVSNYFGSYKKLGQSKNSSGYLYVRFYNRQKLSRKFVHRLVAEYFVKKEDGKNFINHIDENKTNNTVKNIEWCTRSENQIHSLKDGITNRKKSGLGNRKSKYFGIWYNKRNIVKRWVVELQRNNKKLPIKSFKNERDALFYRNSIIKDYKNSNVIL